jgi:hypothetical protein
VNPGGLTLVTVIQLATFLAPLVLARTGFMSGEAAGLSAIVGWFVVGMPLSYAVADRMQRRRALSSLSPHRVSTHLAAKRSTVATH